MRKRLIIAAFALAVGLAASSGFAWGDVRIELNLGQTQQSQDQRRQDLLRERWLRNQWQHDQRQHQLRHERTQSYDFWLQRHRHDYDNRRY